MWEIVRSLITLLSLSLTSQNNESQIGKSYVAEEEEGHRDVEERDAEVLELRTEEQDHAARQARGEREERREVDEQLLREDVLPLDEHIREAPEVRDLGGGGGGGDGC